MDDRRRRHPPADDKMALLPDEVLADVLRRLPPRGLAFSRGFCKAWLAVVDTHRLLRADLLPLSLGGIFMNFNNQSLSELFAPLSDGPSTISGNHDYLPYGAAVSWSYVQDHCNGLLLIHDFDANGDEIGYVLNLATRWLAPFPRCSLPLPMEIKGTSQMDEYLAYDPTESLDFEVVSFTRFLSCTSELDPEIEQSEWPPLVCIRNVFSSRTGQWDERSFTREGDSIGTVSEMRPRCWEFYQRNAVYRRGALYVHCPTDHVMRISLSSGKYHVIKPPIGIEVNDYPQFYLGKSSNGVYCASIKERCRIQVWKLNESGCQMEWVLKHDRDLSAWLLKHKLEYTGSCGNYGKKIQGPWALQDINHSWNFKAPEGHNIKWISQASELGFHPCKEMIFLSESITRGLAYHLSSSSVEVMGNIYPTGYDNEYLEHQFLQSSFPYTPCWITQTADDGDNS